MKTAILAAILISCSAAACGDIGDPGNVGSETAESTAALSRVIDPSLEQPIIVRAGNGGLILVHPLPSPEVDSNLTVYICTKTGGQGGTQGPGEVGSENCHTDQQDHQTRCNVSTGQWWSGSVGRLRALGFNCFLNL